MANNPLPETGFLRLKQIIGDPKADPPVPPIIPVSRSAWWQGIKTRRYPAPVRIGTRVTVWRADEIRALVNGTWKPEFADD
ncbi:MAG: hypothetical protein Tsb0017_08860 [Geothermobacteraceae bacterium]